MSAFATGIEWFFALYFAAAYGGRVGMNVLAVPALRARLALRPFEDPPAMHPGLLPPVSLLVAAHDDEAAIVESVHALLRLEYPQLEMVIVNDGSRDGTLESLTRAFDLEPFPEAQWRGIRTAPVRTFYRSRSHPNVRVVDKEHGGRADALNAAINAARFPLVCTIEVGAVVDGGSVARVIEPFLDDGTAVASGGTVRIASDPSFRPLVLLQTIESLGANLGNVGRTVLGAALPPSRAFSVLRRDALVDAGGYRTGILGEDIELAARLQRIHHARGAAHAVHVLPDPACEIEAAERIADVRSQRMATQRTLVERFRRDRAARAAGSWMIFMELACYGPIVEIAGYACMLAMWVTGMIPGHALGAFLAMAFALGLLVSTSALALDALYLGLYPGLPRTGALAVAAVVENLGYRQLVTAWRAYASVTGKPIGSPPTRG